MDNSFKSIDAILCEAIEMESAALREAYLNEACGADAELRRRVEVLIADHFLAGDFLEAPAVAPIACFAAAAVREEPGMQIDAYTLLEQIGEGGFGVVFLAEQQGPIRRRVALKIIKPGMDTREVIGRFEAERQALALMDHPNIAKVFDAGTVGQAFQPAVPSEAHAHDGDRQAGKPAPRPGRPYFVMELIQGVPITEYCDQCRLTTRERLELFLLGCQAVQHAHQKGVIHRDLKPTNVLVAMQDGKPSPKIIDFGVAKAINQRLTEQSLTAGFAPFIGTPMYMSPEQAELSPLGVDTRSDIYSLGVLLYELLTGATPFDKDRLHAAGFDELRRIIREEDPPRPSARISTMAADLATTVAERHRTDARRLTQTVRGELDWIVMKCLEKDRSRRYESASNLAQEVRRYLDDEPVEACQPSAGYRLRKLVRRNKGPVLSASLVVLALVGGVIGTSWGLLRALAESHQKEVALATAEKNLRKATHAVDKYLTLVSESTLAEDPALEPLRNELLQAALQFYEEFVQQESDNPAIQAELVAAHMRIGYLGYTLDPESDWLTAGEKAFDVMEDLMRKNPSLADLESLQRGIGGSSGASVYIRNPTETLRIFEKGRAVWQQLVDQHPEVIGFQLDLATLISVISGAHSLNGDPAMALQGKRECCALLRKIAEAHPNDPRPRADLAIQLTNLARREARMDRLREAEAAADASVKLAEELTAEHRDETVYQEILAWVRWGPAEVYEHFGQFEKAAEHYRMRVADFETLANQFPTVPRYQHELLYSQTALGEVLWADGQDTKAVKVYDETRVLGERLDPEDTHAQGLRAWFLANCPDTKFRDPDKAVEVADALIKRKGRIGDYWLARGAAKYRLQQWEGARQDLEQGLRLPHEPFRGARLILPMVLWQLGEHDDAQRSYDEAVEWLDKRDLRFAEYRRLRADAAELLGRPLPEGYRSTPKTKAPSDESTQSTQN